MHEDLINVIADCPAPIRLASGEPIARHLVPHVDPERLALHLHTQSRPTGDSWSSPALQEFSDATARQSKRAQERRDMGPKDYTAIRGREEETEGWHSDYDATSGPDE